MNGIQKHARGVASVALLAASVCVFGACGGGGSSSDQGSSNTPAAVTTQTQQTDASSGLDQMLQNDTKLQQDINAANDQTTTTTAPQSGYVAGDYQRGGVVDWQCHMAGYCNP